mgnify:CR=1 FL=1
MLLIVRLEPKAIMDNLNSSIHEQIKELELREAFLKKQIALQKKYQAKLEQFERPNFDLEAMFVQNMAEFKQRYPDIYAAFNQYQLTRFELSHENNHFNIFDTKEKRNLYQHDLFNDSYLQYQDFSEDPTSLTNSFRALKKFGPNTYMHQKFLTELVNTVNDFKRGNDKGVLPDELSSICIMGVGAGFHIEQLCLGHQIQNIFIYEPHLDLFYISLFFTNWVEIFSQLDKTDANVHFSLGLFESEERINHEVRNVFDGFGRYHSGYSFIYKHYYDTDLNNLAAKLGSNFSDQARGFGFYDDILMSIENTVANEEISVPYLSNKFSKIAKRTPVFIVANGPSLDSDIEWLLANQGKAIIVSAGTAISALKAYGLKPDIHCEMERVMNTCNVLRSYYDEDYFKDIAFVGLNTVQPGIFELFNTRLQGAKPGEVGTRILFDDFKFSHKGIAQLLNCNPTVSNCALSFIISMGFEDITLFGVDMGYKGQQHHSKKSFYYDNELDKGFFKPHGELVVKGNLCEQVNTDELFAYSRKEIERLLTRHPDVRVKNCSDGAYIIGTITKPAKTISLPLINNKIERVSNIFSELSVDTQSKGENLIELVIQRDIPLFIELCDFYVEQLSVAPENRFAALDLLDSQLRRLDSFKGSQIGYFDDILRGSLFHTHALLLHSLYSDQNTEQCLGNFVKAANVVCRYINSIKKDYVKHFGVSSKN